MVKHIVITGGAGFLGQHLCRKLLKEGNKISVFDCYFTGTLGEINERSKNNIYNLQQEYPTQLVIYDHNIIEPFTIEGPVDQIYNLACPASPPRYQTTPLFTTDTCYIGLKNSLKLAKEKKARILQASTSEIYGDPDKEHHPQTEEYRGNVNTIGIRSCYDEGKRVGESLMMDYKRTHNIEPRIIRIFNTYGPFMDPEDGRVISNFINQALNNEAITIFGDGSQTRSFCFVTDLIDGMVKLMNSNSVGPVNMGNPIEFTIKEAAELIIKKTESSSEIIYKDLPSDDPLQRKPDISLAKKLLNWEPSISFEKGLDETIKYYKSIR